jgi:ACS family hexuronate transporter-like MFS transporter
LLLGPGMFGLLYALFSLVPSVNVGYVMIFLVGIGFTFVIPTISVAVVHWFPLRIRATALSISQSAVTIGSAFGAIIIPSMSIWLGWRSTVGILGIAVTVIVVLSFSVYREWPHKPSEPRASVLAAIGRVLANKNLIFVGLIGASYLALQICAATYLVLQMVEVRAMSAVEAGTFLMTANIGGAVGRIIWGSISDRAFSGQRKQVSMIIGITSGILAIILAIGIAGMPRWLLYVTIAIFGATAFGWNGVFLAFSTESSGTATAATGLGLAIAITTMGSIVGTPLFGYIVDRTSSYTPAWLVFGIVTMAAALLVTLIKETKATIAPASASDIT